MAKIRMVSPYFEETYMVIESAESWDAHVSEQPSGTRACGSLANSSCERCREERSCDGHEGVSGCSAMADADSKRLQRFAGIKLVPARKTRQLNKKQEGQT